MTDRPRPTGRSRRRHPALGARIAATGISTAAMLGIVAALGAQQSAATDETDATPSASIVVDPAASAPQNVTVSELSDQPIQLTATPVVRAAPAPSAEQATPVARTNGSR